MAAYGLILPKPILDAPRMGCVNIHASLLPRWRGAAPIQRAILAGDAVSGVTIMQMDEGLDTGPMLLTKKLQLDRKNAGQVTQEMAELGAAALLEWLEDRTSHRPQQQPAEGATYAPKIDKAEARIDWTKTCDGNRTAGPRFRARAGRLVRSEWRAHQASGSHCGGGCIGRAGRVLDDCLNIAAGTGYIRPLKVQRAGRSVMTVGELLRGFPIAEGTILQ